MNVGTNNNQYNLKNIHKKREKMYVLSITCVLNCSILKLAFF